MGKRIFIPVAEVSGDLHASHLIRSLRELNAGLLNEGHGGRAVRNFGDAPVVGLLAGSRRSEAARNFPRMLEVAGAIRKRFPKARFLLPTTAATDPIVCEHVGSVPDASIFEIRQGAFDEFVP